MNSIPQVTLNNGVEMPQLGLGVWRVPDAEADAAVASALEAGYRSIDTAALYRNEAGVGRALAASDLPREEIFITTKLWNEDQGYESTLRAFDASMDKLGLDYLDLYLIHWPVQKQNLYTDSWRALEKLYAEKRVKAVGVSNFHPQHLDRLAVEGDVAPAVNQIELHPRLTQEPLREYNRRFGVATQAWSPLGQGGDLLDEPALAGIAAAHHKTAAQVVLRWHVQLGNIVIPKSVTPARIVENIDIFDFALTDEEMRKISALNADARLGPDPDAG